MFSAALRANQVLPFVEVITRCEPSLATATNVPTPVAVTTPYVTDIHENCSSAECMLQVWPPSLDVITRCEPLLATATNMPSPYVTASHWAVPTPFVRGVQVTPSGEVITCGVPPWLMTETATNTPLPAPSSPYVTAYQRLLLTPVDCGVQVTPSGDVITRLVPSMLTATYVPAPVAVTAP